MSFLFCCRCCCFLCVSAISFDLCIGFFAEFILEFCSFFSLSSGGWSSHGVAGGWVSQDFLFLFSFVVFLIVVLLELSFE